VIWADPARDKSPELFHAMGSFIASLSGRYITAGDVGISVADLDVIGETNPWTTGRSPERGGAGDSGILTAFGVWQGMRAAAKHRWGSDALADRTIGILGAGKVGGRLAVHLVEEEGARVIVVDPSTEALESLRDRLGGERFQVAASLEDLLTQGIDVLSPNALGGVLTPDLATRLEVGVVCGGANNQLASAEVADTLAARGVLYAPDYLVNCGGVVQVADELLGFDPDRARARVAGVFDTTLGVLERARSEAITPLAAAAAEAQERIQAGDRPRFAPA
jgi:valine dehydrogenase (NAD+)